MLRYALALLALIFSSHLVAAQTPKLLTENTLYIDLKEGRVVIQLRPDLAPKHVAQIKALTKDGFYNGIVFHRVISGFMAQTGDPTGTGMGGSTMANIPAEFSDTPFVRGVLGMARSQSPNSANSQFFICFTDDGCSFLKGQYTVFGQVTSGMEFVDKVARGEPPATPDTIVKAEIEAAAAPAVTPAAPPAK